MTDPVPSPSDRRYRAFATAAKANDQSLADLVAQMLDMTMPPQCVPGVAANMRLLEKHWAVLREAPGDG